MQSMPVLYDTVVVGAGLAGAAIARRLADAGEHVLVLEARAEIGGMSVRGCGLALLGTPEPYASLVERMGAEKARRIWAFTEDNLELLGAAADAVDVPVRLAGSFRVTEDSGDALVLEDSLDLLEEAGFDVELDDATDAGYLIGLRTEDDLVFDPAALIAGLLTHADIVVRTDVEVQKLNENDASVDIWMRKHYVRAQRVILAAGPHLVHLSDALQGAIVPVPMHSVYARSEEELMQPWILDAGKVLLCDTGEQWQMAAWSQDAEADPWDQLVQVSEQLCPGARITARHSGWVARTPDDLPIVGAVPGHKSVHVVGGLGAWGASWAFVAAEQLMKRLANESVSSLLSLDRFSEETINADG